MLPRTLLPGLLGALGLSAVVLSGCSKETTQRDVDRSTITLNEVRALVEKSKPGELLIADARGPRAFAEGHIPGAQNLAVSRFSGVHGETDPALVRFTTIVVYGDNPGSGSANALAMRMMSTGYDNIRTFFEGFDAWKRAGLPVESAPRPEGEAAGDAPGK
jgi:3-mercaptopyruvate sulfurtransferase SseA